MFITLFCGLLDLGTGRLEFSGAGHNAASPRSGVRGHPGIFLPYFRKFSIIPPHDEETF
jgi:hypothetical protein